MQEFIQNAEKEINQNKIKELKSWQYNFRRNKDGVPLANSVNNVELILSNDNLLKGKVRFNEFTYEEFLTSHIVLNGVAITSNFIEDSFTHALIAYIEKEYGFVPKPQSIESAVINVSKRNSFHPIKDYLEQAKSEWDGEERIKTLLADYLGVEQSEYSFKGFLCLLIGSIQKIYSPEEKFDFIFDFVGGQGAGKTSFLQRLFLDNQGYYTDSMRTFDKIDDITIMQKCWCANDDEMQSTKATSIQSLKKFASQTMIEYRLPYAKRSIRRPRNFVICRTSNMPGHLVDETGNRRFVPFKVRKEKQKYHPLQNGTFNFSDSLVKQIWGESMALYSEIDRPQLFREVELLAEEHLEEFMAEDSIKEIVYAVLDVPVPYNFYDYNDNQRASYVQGYLSNNNARLTIGGNVISTLDIVPRDRIRVRDISLEGFAEPMGKNNKRDSRIRLVMDNHKNWEKSSRNGLRFGKYNATGYKLKNRADKQT